MTAEDEVASWLPHRYTNVGWWAWGGEESPNTLRAVRYADKGSC